MNKKEKAKELVEKFMQVSVDFGEYGIDTLERDEAKQCALIAVDREIKILEDIYEYKLGDSYIWQKLEEAKELKEEIKQL